jgi:hypothetical protein
MTASTEDFGRTKITSPRKKFFPVRALNQDSDPVVIHRGDLVVRRKGVNLAEVAEDANPRTDLIPLGIAQCQVDMTGKADGDLSVAVLSGGWGDFDTGTSGNAITDDDIGKTAYIKDNNTLYLTDDGGTLSPCGPIMFGDDDGDEVGIAVWIDGELGEVVADVATAQAAIAALQTVTANQQVGTGTLVAGVATISTATITATSRIQITMKDPGAGAITGFAGFTVPAADRAVGAPGSFKVYAIDDAKATISTAVCTFDWEVVG